MRSAAASERGEAADPQLSSAASTATRDVDLLLGLRVGPSYAARRAIAFARSPFAIRAATSTLSCSSGWLGRTAIGGESAPEPSSRDVECTAAIVHVSSAEVGVERSDYCPRMSTTLRRIFALTRRARRLATAKMSDDSTPG